MSENRHLGPGSTEPSLRQVLDDPIVHLIMRRDGLTVEEVRDVVRSARARLLRPPAGAEE